MSFDVNMIIAPAPEDDEEVDETGVDPKDIELVIQQVGCSRAKAVRVLKESGGDLINASKSFAGFWLV
jgi:nascent polypeptide-associated complex subunit alpha